ncbi:hypothetical protein BDN70DRAFT_902423, partial [Pholiota conissans]
MYEFFGDLAAIQGSLQREGTWTPKVTKQIDDALTAIEKRIDQPTDHSFRPCTREEFDYQRERILIAFLPRNGKDYRRVVERFLTLERRSSFAMPEDDNQDDMPHHEDVEMTDVPPLRPLRELLHGFRIPPSRLDDTTTYVFDPVHHISEGNTRCENCAQNAYPWDCFIHRSDLNTLGDSEKEHRCTHCRRIGITCHEYGDGIEKRLRQPVLPTSDDYWLAWLLDDEPDKDDYAYHISATESGAPKTPVRPVIYVSSKGKERATGKAAGSSSTEAPIFSTSHNLEKSTSLREIFSTTALPISPPLHSTSALPSTSGLLPPVLLLGRQTVSFLAELR